VHTDEMRDTEDQETTDGEQFSTGRRRSYYAWKVFKNKNCALFANGAITEDCNTALEMIEGDPTEGRKCQTQCKENTSCRGFKYFVPGTGWAATYSGKCQLFSNNPSENMLAGNLQDRQPNDKNIDCYFILRR